MKCLQDAKDMERSWRRQTQNARRHPLPHGAFLKPIRNFLDVKTVFRIEPGAFAALAP
jgi:hypothetical protein